MSETLLRALQSLRDVDGVLGSFVWSHATQTANAGGVIARDLPEYFDSPVLSEIGPRLERIYGAFEDAGDELDGALLVFAEHKLHIRKIERAYIAVLTSVRVNMPSLKMALSLVGRRVSTELANNVLVEPLAGLAAQTAVAASRPPAAPPPPPPEAEAKPVRLYRGNRVSEP